MTAVKTLNAWGFGAKIESTYGTLNAPTTTDGILLAEKPTPDGPAFLVDGRRGVAPGGGPRVPVFKGGREGMIDAMAEGIGGGVAYSASVKPSLDVLMRICGLDATSSFTGGAEFWKYAPEIGPTGLESATVDAHMNGEQFRIRGTYGDFELNVDGPNIPIFTFHLKGIGEKVSDVAIPAYSNYPSFTNLPPKAEAITLVIGTYTGAIVRSLSFKQNRQHDAARANMNAAAPSHAGFTPGSFDPELTVVFEAVALHTATPWTTATTIDPYSLAEDQNSIFLSFNVGSVQYKRYKFFAGGPAASAAQAYVRDAKRLEDGPTRTWEVTFGFHGSTYLLNDHYTFTWD